jgi:hypothetical protein
MTDEQINIAIAEACGWTDFSSAGHAGSIQYGRKPGSPLASWELPRYVSDLNAMREAEQKLWSMNWELRFEFIHQLAKVVNPIHGYRMQEGIDLLDVTARQRAEALLKTINQWGDKE